MLMIPKCIFPSHSSPLTYLLDTSISFFYGHVKQSKIEFINLPLQLDSSLGFPISYHRTIIHTSSSDQKANVGFLLNARTPPSFSPLHRKSTPLLITIFSKPSIFPISTDTTIRIVSIYLVTMYLTLC